MFRKRQAFPPIEHSILYNIFCTIATKRFAKCRQNSRKCTKEFHKAIRYHSDTVIPFLLSLLYTLRLTSAYITENSGMNRMIPNTPDTLPPTTTASTGVRHLCSPKRSSLTLQPIGKWAFFMKFFVKFEYFLCCNCCIFILNVI